MSFSRANALGWAMFEVLTSAQMNAIDTNQSRALDGNAGGDYSTIAADIVFNGAQSIAWGTGRYPKLASRTLRRMQRLAFTGASAHGGSPNFLHSSISGVVSQDYVDGSGLDDPQCFFPIDNLIDRALMTAISVVIRPSSTAPAEKPRVALFRFPHDDFGAIVGSEVADPTADGAGTYQQFHAFGLSALTEAIDETATPAAYVLRFKGENGAGASTGLQVVQVRADFTTTLVTPGG